MHARGLETVSESVKDEIEQNPKHGHALHGKPFGNCFIK